MTGANGAPAEPVGLLGGTFDPVHCGHLEIADRIRAVLGLSRVLLLPTALPPHKSAAGLAPAAHRATMLRLALAGTVGLELSLLELVEDRVCYTIDTLRCLRGGRPARSPIFCVGLDALLQLHTWRSHREMLESFDLAAVDRTGDALETVRDRLAPEIAERIVRVPNRPGALDDLGLPPIGSAGRIFHVAFEPIDISSSEVRARAACGLSLEGLVPPAVAAYIHEHRIYRQEESL